MVVMHWSLDQLPFFRSSWRRAIDHGFSAQTININVYVHLSMGKVWARNRRSVTSLLLHKNWKPLLSRKFSVCLTRLDFQCTVFCLSFLPDFHSNQTQEPSETWLDMHLDLFWCLPFDYSSNTHRPDEPMLMTRDWWLLCIQILDCNEWPNVQYYNGVKIPHLWGKCSVVFVEENN